MKQTSVSAKQTAAQILELTRRRLAQEIPALMLPLYLFRDQPIEKPIPPSTDGAALFYCPQQLIADFKADRNLPARQLVHVLLHCLLGHLPQRRGVKRLPLFDALADCRVQAIMDQLLPRLRVPKEREEDGLPIFPWTRLLEEEPNFNRPMPQMYRAIREDWDLMGKALNKRASCALDEHGLWNPTVVATGMAGQSDEKSGKENQPSQGFGQVAGQPAPNWQAVMKSLVDQGSESGWGALPGVLREAFCPAEENQITYRDFLRRFACPRERLLTDPDGLDARWYCLGLELYGDIPLIESPELSEPPAPDQLVIAMDTSGSCQGEVARRFLRETLNLLRDVSAGASRFQVLLLQCDTRIQQEVWLESVDQVDTLEEVFEPRGFGGTDFRPVFCRVEQLRKEGKLFRVQGLLYLSDGWGDYPDTPPDYPVAFLIPGEERNCWFSQPSRPSWLTTLYLDPNEFTVEEASE